MRYLDRLQPLALLVMRLALGSVMLAHGSQKVFGNLHNFSHMVSGMGIPAWLAYVAAFTEFGGGILILAGFFTRPVAFAMCIDMFVASWKVHWHNGLLGSPGRPGYELTMALFSLAFALMFLGGGPIALDHVLRGGGGASKRS